RRAAARGQREADFEDIPRLRSVCVPNLERAVGAAAARLRPWRAGRGIDGARVQRHVLELQIAHARALVDLVLDGDGREAAVGRVAHGALRVVVLGRMQTPFAFTGRRVADGEVAKQGAARVAGAGDTARPTEVARRRERARVEEDVVVAGAASEPTR